MLRAARPLLCQAAIDSLKKKIHVRYALHACQKRVLSRSEYHTLCSSPSVPAEYRMTQSELDSFLIALHEARLVVMLDNDTLHIRPLELVNDVHAAVGAPPVTPGLPQISDEQAKLRAAIDSHERKSEAALVQTARFRKRFWSAVAVGSGTQMLGLSYLTFVHYDWDVMEPACFFVSAGTSIFFYLYQLLFRREHSLQAVDENLLPKHLDQALQAAGVDAAKWAQDAQRLHELDAAQRK
jgi:hypothetical protein